MGGAFLGVGYNGGAFSGVGNVGGAIWGVGPRPEALVTPYA